MKAKSDLSKFSISIAVPLLAALLGSLFTTSGVKSWYPMINKPSWNPPSWLFGPVWTVLFLMMGVALYIVWKQGVGEKRRLAIKVFFIQLGLNVLWSALFFGLRNFWLAYAEILVLWALIFMTINKFNKVSKLAGGLLVPYLMWVTFASFLNLTIASLN